MAIPGLTIIGESINDSVPSTKKLFDANDIDGLLALAKSQDEKGAAYIDVNVGRRTPAFMADMVKRIQTVTAKPLSIDSPDPEIVAAALAVYDKNRSGGKIPVLNSISSLRLKMFDLYKIHPFMPILLVSERAENGRPMPCVTAEETYNAAKALIVEARKLGLPNSQCIFDPGIAPIASDSEGNLKRLLDSARMIHNDADLAGVHMSVGLSNFTVMLPPKRPDGLAVKSSLESAFLTLAMPLGLDMVIGSMARKYETLTADHPAMVCVNEVLQMEGFDTIIRVKEFYS